MDNDSASNAAAAGIFGAFALVWFVFLIAVVAFSIWLFWRIFTKAGYSGALAFLTLIPGVGVLIALLILAFGTWPAENELAAYRSGRMPTAPGMGGLGGAPIGGPPMASP